MCSLCSKNKWNVTLLLILCFGKLMNLAGKIDYSYVCCLIHKKNKEQKMKNNEREKIEKKKRDWMKVFVVC